jgi:hypothetical protein
MWHNKFLMKTAYLFLLMVIVFDSKASARRSFNSTEETFEEYKQRLLREIQAERDARANNVGDGK